MNDFLQTAVVLAAHTHTQLPDGAFDLGSLLRNGKTLASTLGGLFLILMGLVAVIMAGVFLITKLMKGSQGQSKHGWGQIIALGVVGGAIFTGGLTFLLNISSGAQTTIEQLGTGVILLQSVPGLGW